MDDEGPVLGRPKRDKPVGEESTASVNSPEGRESMGKEGGGWEKPHGLSHLEKLSAIPSSPCSV